MRILVVVMRVDADIGGGDVCGCGYWCGDVCGLGLVVTCVDADIGGGGVCVD